MSTFGGAVTGLSPGAGEEAGERMSADAAVDGPTTFEDLFRRRYEPMVRVAFLLVRARAGAEDVVQDAFARMELRWTRLDNPEGYLHRCVVNRCHDLLRRRRLEQGFLRLRRDELADAFFAEIEKKIVA